MTDRFTDFLKSLEADTYPEPPSQIHEEITARVLPEVVKAVTQSREGAEPLRVLDVGCGQGVALKRFKELGCKAYGITTNADDLAACEKAGFDVSHDDMHFQNDGLGPYFDLIWARHVLEHSPMPFFVLRDFYEILQPGGWLYIEVPMPGTACNHDIGNANHYSVLPCSGWQSLITKAKFQLVEATIIPLNTQAGPDEYRSYLCRKVIC